MNLHAVLSKTDKGTEEIATRKHGLDQRMRSLLIVVNGKSTGGELLEKFAQMGDLAAKLELLLAHGFIAEAAVAAGSPEGGAASAQFVAARTQVAKVLSDALGPTADSICIKIEACSTAQELREYLDGRRDLIEVALGRKSGEFWAKTKELLG